LRIPNFDDVTGDTNSPFYIIGFEINGILEFNRIVKNHHIISLHAGESGEPEIGQLNGVGIGGEICAPDLLMGQWHLDDCSWRTGTIMHFADKQKVTYQ